MADFNEINATMEAGLRAEGCTRTSTASPTAEQIEEFLGRFKTAAAAHGAYFSPPDNTTSFLKLCAGALALIVGRGALTDPWKQFEFAVVGANGDPARQADIINKYRPRLSAPVNIDATAIRTEALKIAASVARINGLTN